MPAQQVTLAWQHSIEKIRWEEDYAVVGLAAPGDTPDSILYLKATAARVQGSGAGMEPPADAVLRQGWYHYVPTTPLLSELRLTRSTFTPDYELCVGGQCQPLAQWLVSDGWVTRMWACQRP